MSDRANLWIRGPTLDGLRYTTRVFGIIVVSLSDVLRSLLGGFIHLQAASG
jgi:hypothetical protein